MPRRVLRAVLFDLGGTLVRTAYDRATVEAAWAAGLRAVQREGMPSAAEALLRFRSTQLPRLARWRSTHELDYLGLVDELLRSFGVALERDELTAVVRAQLVVARRMRRLHPEARPVLGELRRRGLRLALVSNASEPGALMRTELRALRLADAFDAVVFSSEVGRRKPDPAPFRAALDRLAIAPSEALHVGDEPLVDVAGARRLGILPALACWFGDHSPRRSGTGATRLACPRDLLELVAASHG